MDNTGTNQAAALTYSVEEVAKLLGLSRSLTYAAVKTGELPSIQVGRRILIPRVALTRMLEAKIAAASA